MNIHNIVPPGVWFWVNNRGGNGRTLGTHLYNVSRTTRPGINDEDPNRAWRGRWWIPPHFSWRPFQYALRNLHANNRYTPGLCGRPSASRFASAAYEHGPTTWTPLCQDCTRLAAERGIMGQFYNMFERTDPEYQALQREMEEWQRTNTNLI